MYNLCILQRFMRKIRDTLPHSKLSTLCPVLLLTLNVTMLFSGRKYKKCHGQQSKTLSDSSRFVFASQFTFPLNPQAIVVRESGVWNGSHVSNDCRPYRMPKPDDVITHNVIRLQEVACAKKAFCYCLDLLYWETKIIYKMTSSKREARNSIEKYWIHLAQ